MADTEIRGLGAETGDTVGAAVFGVLTVALDGFLLTRIWRWAGEQTAAEHRTAVTQTAVLVGVVLFATLLGVAVAGQRSTPHRRWYCAMITALASHLLLPLAVIVAVATHWGHLLR
ncbi:hypothetical protein ACWC9T_20695 [Kitasatospora sp. NPDC001159]